MTETESFMHSILRAIPGLSDLFREHEAEYGEMLPHVLLADVTRLALEWGQEAHADSVIARAPLESLVETLEQAMQSGPESVRELVVVSFLENLDWRDPGFALVKKCFGPSLVGAWTRLGKA